jgi:hypothetical protein
MPRSADHYFRYRNHDRSPDGRSEALVHLADRRRDDPGPGRYAMPRWSWRDFGRRPVASIRFRTATPVAASVFSAVKPRARSRGPIGAFYRHTSLACRAIRAQGPGFPEANEATPKFDHSLQHHWATAPTAFHRHCPSVPSPGRHYTMKRTDQEQCWASRSELSEPALACPSEILRPNRPKLPSAWRC